MYYSLLRTKSGERLKVVICADREDMHIRRIEADRDGLIAFSVVADEIPAHWQDVPVEQSDEIALPPSRQFTEMYPMARAR